MRGGRLSDLRGLDLRRRRRAAAILVVTLAACGGTAFCIWDGNGTTHLQVREAVEVTRDPSAPPSRRKAALLALRRHALEAIDAIRAATGDPETMVQLEAESSLEHIRHRAEGR